ncbi:MAG: histidine kinase [Anaerolineae bacterium]|jgi:signal transduction histidine kinase
MKPWQDRLALRVRGLRVQIVLWTVLPLTLVLIGVAFTGVYSHEQSMRTLVQERDQALATVSAAQVRDLLQARAAALESLAAEQAFHHQDTATQQALLANAAADRGLDQVALLDEVGRIVIAGSEPLAWAQDASVPGLAREVMVRQDAVLAPLAGASGAGYDYLIAVPVYDEAGTTYGLLAAPLSLASLDLERLLGQARVGAHGVVYLVDGQGKVLARSSSEGARTSLAGHTGLDVVLQAEVAGATLCQAPDGERMTLAYAPVAFGSAGWRILVEQPWREVIGPVLRYSQFMPLVVALAVVVSLLTLYYGIRAIVRPLQTLGEKAEQVAWGDFEATSSPVGGVEEIEDLRRTLDQMAKRIQSYQSGMHDYIAAITQGQEEERKRLARELHDETAQALIALRHQVEMSQKLLPRDPDRAAARLGQVRILLAETVEGIRRFSRDLRPIYLEDLGFIPALEMLARSNGQGPNIHFDTTGGLRRLPPDLELAAYRIVQEALNNALQHAGASQVWVEVGFEDAHLVLSVRDDGQGFEAPARPDALAREGHFGLMGIQERAMLYGGQLSIRSAPGQGTTVSVRIPYPSQPTPPNGGV